MYLCTVKTSIYTHCDHTTRNRPIKIFDLDFYDKLNPTRILIGSYQWFTRGQTRIWRHHFKTFCFFVIKKQINSTLRLVCTAIDHRGRQNVVRKSVTHSAAPLVPLTCSYRILTSSVTYYWTDERQHREELSNYLCATGVWNFEKSK